MNLGAGEQIVFQRSDILGLGSSRSSILKELITTNMRLIAKFSEEEISIPFNKISQVQIKFDKGGRLLFGSIWCFLFGIASLEEFVGLGLIFFALSAYLGYLKYKNRKGTTYLSININSTDTPIVFWQKGESDNLIYFEECIEKYSKQYRRELINQLVNKNK